MFKYMLRERHIDVYFTFRHATRYIRCAATFRHYQPRAIFRHTLLLLRYAAFLASFRLIFFFAIYAAILMPRQ